MKYIHNKIFLEPLCLLTRKGVSWHWFSVADSAFQQMKYSLTKEPCLAYNKLNTQTFGTWGHLPTDSERQIKEAY